jgi:hypothetical protein
MHAGPVLSRVRIGDRPVVLIQPYVPVLRALCEPSEDLTLQLVGFLFNLNLYL